MTLDQLNLSDAFARNNGIALTSEGVAQMTVQEQHLNGAGVCQGGAIFTLADLSQAGLTQGRALTTAANIHFIHSARLGDTLIATSTWIHDGKLPLVRTEVRTEGGRLIAEMTGSLFRIESSINT